MRMRRTGRGVTGMPATGSPTVRRRELGAVLRSLRAEAGLTADEVAGHLGVSPSKVSRLETGQRGASPQDIRRLCDLYAVDDEQRRRLLELASEGKQRAWWQPLGLPYFTYVGLEAEARFISDYGLGTVPGLLQTPDFARAMVRAAVPTWTPEIVEQRVRGRIARQRLLYSASAPAFEAILDESVLYRVVGSPAIMEAQLRHLQEMSELSSVTIRVLPYDAGALPAPNTKFILLRFEEPAVSDTVFIEGLTGDLYLDEPGEVEVYNATFRTLVDLAQDPADTRQIIGAMIDSYSRRVR
jgi:transcriptional regulator with XRE-family HTH domain